MSVLLETSAGDLVIDLLTDESPKACLNFLKLCKVKYYNFAPIYNLQTPSFFQAGDPNYPVGDGGSSCWGLKDKTKSYFKPEITTRRVHERGTISMACSAEGFCGSQFFVALGPNPSFDKKHAIFGRLAEGFDTLDKISAIPVDGAYRLMRDVRIKHTIILEDPYPDPPDLLEAFRGQTPDSPVPTELQLSTVRISYETSLEDDDEGDAEAAEARKRAREAESSALTLETLGDLPFASIRPPENILFVCKLNPVTTSADLDLIFGRFGTILSCQVVKDRRTGDSLQYAFIEFDLKADAERAYFKMQGVLIDDRRIHVDFSQSVAKTGLGRTLGSANLDVKGKRGREDEFKMVFDDRAQQRSSRDRTREYRDRDRDRDRDRSYRDDRNRHRDDDDRARRRDRDRSRSRDRYRSHHRSERR